MAAGKKGKAAANGKSSGKEPAGESRSGANESGSALLSAIVCVVMAITGALFLAQTEQGRGFLERHPSVANLLSLTGSGGGRSGMVHRRALTAAEAAKPEKTVHVFMNAEHEGGREFNLTMAEHGNSPDLGQVLSAVHNCSNFMEPEDDFYYKPGYCKVYSELGQRVLSYSSLRDHDNVYLVPHDRLFIFPAGEVGREFSLPHITTPKGGVVSLQTLSDSPRVFKLNNFMDDSEAEQIILDALAITDDAHKLKRSSTGTKGNKVSKTRTSENAFVTQTETAMVIKRRIFKLLGIEEYNEHWADGLQVLRYNVSKAYTPHLDYLESDGLDHDFDSANYGANRFATVVLYFSDVEDGGETVFTKTAQPGEDMPPLSEALESLRDDKKQMLEEIGITTGSWEERLLAQCRTRLRVKPKRGDAVLFYSQTADGAVDKQSEHGACPVITGQKWAANLWVWNGARYGYTKKDPITGRNVEIAAGALSTAHFAVKAVFQNPETNPPVTLYYGDDQLWDTMAPGKLVTVNSFVGHVWNVMLESADPSVGSQKVIEWKVEKREPNQTFVVPPIPQAAAAP